MGPKPQPKLTEKSAGVSDEHEASGRNVTCNFSASHAITNYNFTVNGAVINNYCRHAHNDSGRNGHGHGAGGDEGSTPCKEEQNEQFLARGRRHKSQ